MSGRLQCFVPVNIKTYEPENFYSSHGATVNMSHNECDCAFDWKHPHWPGCLCCTLCLSSMFLCFDWNVSVFNNSFFWACLVLISLASLTCFWRGRERNVLSFIFGAVTFFPWWDFIGKIHTAFSVKNGSHVVLCRWYKRGFSKALWQLIDFLPVWSLSVTWSQHTLCLTHTETHRNT